MSSASRARRTSSIPVPAAELVHSESHLIVGGIKIVDRWFTVPLDYSRPGDGKIDVFARSAINNKENDNGAAGAKQPICVYLQGGPGFECSPPKSHPLTEFFFGKGYQMLYLDQRGTGLSTPVDADVWMAGCTVDEKVERLKLMRADNIVRDCEAIRKHMLGAKDKEEDRKWTVHGQSFGGFCAVTYLSFYPEGLKEVFTTGGMPPLVNNPDPVYDRTYRKLQERNAVYYSKYPQDVHEVRRIMAHLQRECVSLPSGGRLTEGRFQELGHAFGGHGGIDTVHRIVQRVVNDLDCYGGLTYKSKQMIEAQQSFDGNPLYAILHEACYCQGEHSDWSAARRLPSEPRGADDPVLFTGEMIYPRMFDDYAELAKFREVADRLARYTEWPALYDVDQLRRNEVPVYAANFIDDMYVAYDLSRKTVATIRGARSFDTNVLMHNAVRAKTWAVMGELWKLRGGEVD